MISRMNTCGRSLNSAIAENAFCDDDVSRYLTFAVELRSVVVKTNSVLLKCTVIAGGTFDNSKN